MEKDEDVSALKARISELEEALKSSAPTTPSGAGLLMTKRGGAAVEAITPRTTIVLFGADGNLATKKTFPTLFALWRKQLLPRSTLIVGYARDEVAAETFRRVVYKSIYSSAHSQSERTSFLERCHYVAGQFDDASHFRERLKPTLEKLEKKRSDRFPSSSGNECLRVYYLAVPPFLYASICTALRDSGVREPASSLSPPYYEPPFEEGGGPPFKAGSSQQQQQQFFPPDFHHHQKHSTATLTLTRHRYVLEKPFGRDLQSCRALCAALGEVVREDEAYRIDHYLGKELVMNVLVLRFANVCFEAIWSRFHVARVEVCCLEEIGTAGRGGYFDKYGIIRDVMQNHLAQILALVAMEQPLSFEADDIRREKVKVLRSVRKLDASRDLVVGQYDGYVDDESVIDKRSKTETFAAARLYIDNPRWSGVPFILTAAKAVSQKKVEVKITFHKVAGAVADCSRCDPNELVVRVQPDECIYWRVQNRVPGLHSKLKIEPRRMNLLYTPTESRGMPEAYERLLLEVIRGDATNFVSVDELDAAWSIFNDALDNLAERPSRPERYAFGSEGPCTKRLIDPKHRQTATPSSPTPYGHRRLHRQENQENHENNHTHNGHAHRARRGENNGKYQRRGSSSDGRLSSDDSFGSAVLTLVEKNKEEDEHHTDGPSTFELPVSSSSAPARAALRPRKASLQKTTSLHQPSTEDQAHEAQYLSRR